MHTFSIRVLIASASLLFLIEPSFAEQQADEGPAITVYSSADPASFDPQQFITQARMGYNPHWIWQVPGFGVVKEVRKVSLKSGYNELRFTDVAEFIDPTTVSFADLTDPETAVLEQNFQFDLVSPGKIFEKYIDREIGYEIDADGGKQTAQYKLLSVNQGRLVVLTPDGLRFLDPTDQNIKIASLPEELITKPTLLWKLDAVKEGEHTIRTTYQTNGITWRADYSLILNADDTRADLGAWVSLMNLSGAAYRNARLKLIAGDVQRVRDDNYTYNGMAQSDIAQSMGGGRARAFEEKSFFEYHLYTLPRRTDVLANTTQQIMLFPTARDAGVEKVLVYYGLPNAARWAVFPNPMTDRAFGVESNTKVDMYIRFLNSKDNNLGMPLPKGKVRVYKLDEQGVDADGTLEFIGEDLIDHTPKDEKVLVKVGQAFDVVGERKQLDFNMNTAGKTIIEKIHVQLRNRKDEPAKVIIKENLYRWVTWEITEKSDAFEKIDSRTIHFEVTLPPNTEKTVTYTVKYTW